MIKVLNILTDTNVGGAGRIFLQYLKCIDRTRFDVRIAVPSGSKLTPLIKELGFDVIETEHGHDKTYEKGAVGEYKRIIKDVKPDIVHTHSSLSGKIAAFAGASGVGKSTLLNRLFPHLALSTSEISRKIERGRHTTRQVELFALSEGENCGYIADTPGFSMLDFERFDFMDCEDLPLAMREFVGRIGQCRYTKCSHTKEEGCAIVDAVRRGEIPKSRHDSFCELHAILKAKKKWDKR